GPTRCDRNRRDIFDEAVGVFHPSPYPLPQGEGVVESAPHLAPPSPCGRGAGGRGMRSRYDAIIIGAGHNGLVAAAYLARHGLATLSIERAERIGGACITDKILPGYRVSGAAQVLGMLRPQVVDDLE